MSLSTDEKISVYKEAYLGYHSYHHTIYIESMKREIPRRKEMLKHYEFGELIKKEKPKDFLTEKEMQL